MHPHPLPALDLTHISYGPHPLQHLLLHTPPPASSPPLHPPPFVVFIHGGAWRDPTKTALSTTTHLFPFLTHYLPASPLASISYRLSPHPQHPNPNNTARHPDHIDDVMSALVVLQQKFKMSRFILAGHSCGATLAFQALRRIMAGELMRVLPGAVVGLEGIYDVKGIVREGGAPYKEFIDGAGLEGGEGLEGGVGGYEGLCVLVHSDEDELVGWAQAEGWKGVCERTVGVGGGVRMVKVMGGHDEVLEREGLAAVVARYVNEVFKD